MRVVIIIALTTLLTGCSRNGVPVIAYRHFDDQVKAMAGGLLGIPCSRKVGEALESIREEDCLRLGDAQTMTGIWLTEFEASRFLQNRQWPPRVWRWTPNDVELIPAKNLPKKLADLAYAPPRRAFLVTFVGRSVSYPMHNRWGGIDAVVVMDKVLTIQPVKAPTRTEFCLPKCKPA